MAAASSTRTPKTMSAHACSIQSATSITNCSGLNNPAQHTVQMTAAYACWQVQAMMHNRKFKSNTRTEKAD